MQMSYLYASDFLFKNVCKIAQHTETIRKRCLVKETTMNYISIFALLCFYDNSNVKENVFFQSASWKRNCAAHWREQRGWELVTSYWFVLSMRMQVILDSTWTLLSPARVQPLQEAGRKESSGTGLSNWRLDNSNDIGFLHDQKEGQRKKMNLNISKIKRGVGLEWLSHVLQVSYIALALLDNP